METTIVYWGYIGLYRDLMMPSSQTGETRNASRKIGLEILYTTSSSLGEVV